MREGKATYTNKMRQVPALSERRYDPCSVEDERGETREIIDVVLRWQRMSHRRRGRRAS